MNNLSELINIFLGDFNQTTFIIFLTDYKQYLKSLNLPVITYKLLNKDVIDYISINTIVFKEKALYSNLNIESQEKMDQLVDLVYFEPKLEAMYIQISYNN